MKISEDSSMVTIGGGSVPFMKRFASAYAKLSPEKRKKIETEVNNSVRSITGRSLDIDPNQSKS